MVAKVPVGIIGCGNISPAYIKGCRMFEILDLVAVADIDMSRAQNRAAEHDVPVACTVEELLANPDIEIVINLTTPKAHAAVNLAAIAAGKNVHCEKPLAVDAKTAPRCSPRRRRRASWSAARPTPSSAAASRPAAS